MEGVTKDRETGKESLKKVHQKAEEGGGSGVEKEGRHFCSDWSQKAMQGMRRRTTPVVQRE